MTIQTTAAKNLMATAYSTNVGAYGAIGTGTPNTTSFGTEVTGGSPAYARIAPSWGSAASSAISASAMNFNVPSSTTVTSFGFFSLSSAGTYYDGVTITSQLFSSQGTYAITPTYTQS